MKWRAVLSQEFSFSLREKDSNAALSQNDLPLLVGGGLHVGWR
jgi:hypothetical protein